MLKKPIKWGARLLAGSVLLSQIVTSAFAQNPCTNPGNCIVNGTLNAASTGNMNSSAATTVNSWFISHGTPTVFSNGSPGGGNRSVWMWSYSGSGEGIFTCYNFQSGRSYRICMWVRNTNTISAGNLQVLAANGLNAVAPVGTGGVPPVPPSSQVINNTFTNSGGVWQLLTFDYTPNQNYSQLWIYPFMAGPPINNQQYELQVDDIRVTERVGITTTAATIGWCGSATLCVTGGPASGATYSWSPATGLSSTTTGCVTASPCQTTTYQVVVNSNDTNCPSCGDTASITVNVTQPTIGAYNNGPINCGEELIVKADDYPCATYTWYAPNGAVYSGSYVSIPGATDVLSGTWTLVVSYGGCSYTYTTDVVVNECPCEFTADFKWEGCNPVFFYDNSTGYGTSVGWFWEFGDGTTSNLQNPVHIYPAAGVYKVCLTVIRKSGDKTCCDRICKEIDVCDPPQGCFIKAGFTYSAANQPPYTINFNNATVTNGIICDIKWDFGDGTSSTLENPVHVFPGPGVYTVCVYVRSCIYDDQGNLIEQCEDRYCFDVEVREGGGNLREARFGETGNSQKGDKFGGNSMVKVYPNPASHDVMISVQGMRKAEVLIMNVNGAVVMKAKELKPELFSSNLSTLARGIYFVRVKSVDGVRTVKFIKE